MTNKIEQLQSAFAQQAKQVQSGKLTLEKVSSIVKEVEFEKQLNIDEKNKEFTVCKKSLSFWAKSEANIIEVEMYENLWEKVKGLEGDDKINEEIENANKQLTQNGYSNVQKDKYLGVLDKCDQNTTVYELYHKKEQVEQEKEQKKEEEVKKEEEAKNQQQSKTEEIVQDKKEQQQQQQHKQEQQQQEKQKQQEQDEQKVQEKGEEDRKEQQEQGKKEEEDQKQVQKQQVSDYVEGLFSKLKEGNVEILQKEVQAINNKLQDKVSKQDIQQFYSYHKNEQSSINYEQFEKWHQSKKEIASNKEEKESSKSQKAPNTNTNVSKTMVLDMINSYLQNTKGVQDNGKQQTQQMKVCLKLGNKQWTDNANVQLSLSVNGQTHKNNKQELQSLDIINEERQCQQMIFIRVKMDNAQNLKQYIDKMIQNSEQGLNIRADMREDNEIVITINKSQNQQKSQKQGQGSEEQQKQQKQQKQQEYVYEILKTLNDKVGKITQNTANCLDFNAKLTLCRQQFEDTEQRMIETVLQGFKLQYSLNVNSCVWAVIRKNIQLKQQSQFKLLFALMKKSNIQFGFKEINDIHKFLTKLGIAQLIKETPKIGQFLKDFMQVFSCKGKPTFTNVLQTIFKSDKVQQLSLNAMNKEATLCVKVQGRNIERIKGII